MPFKHAHPVDLTVGEQHHVDFGGRRFGHERHVQASAVPGVTPGAVVAHTHRDVDERTHEETGMSSHHLAGTTKVAQVTAEFDADLLDAESAASAPVGGGGGSASPRRRDLDSE
jgi:hypothetical protein